MVDNIRKLCEKAGITINQLEKAAGLGRGTIYRWDEKTPAIDKANAVAEYFSVSLDELYNSEEVSVSKEAEDVWEVRERLRTQPGMRLLFDATSKATPEELEAVANMFIAMRGNRDE